MLTNFLLGVPTGQEKQSTRKETGLDGTKEETAGKERGWVLALRHSDNHTTPDDTDGRQVDRRLDLHQQHVGGYFEQDVGDEEERYEQRVFWKQRVISVGD
jgi:hypothetical protein